jgi:alanyl-tRNA synthetase
MPRTECLYYQDPYLSRFTGRIIARQLIEGRPAVALDRTAFYPTGGGQPCDTGALSGVPVLDVMAADGLIWHVVAGDIPGIEVDGEIAWARRFDHMQQHTGQHVISQAFVQVCDAETVAFHLGATSSTIDLNRTALGTELIAAAEAAANAVVDAALPVTADFVGEAQLSQMPLRKPPKVTEDIRVVQVAGFDWSACGGTHVANTAQIGLVKIVATERRGVELRVSFLCGGRARADYMRLQLLIGGLATRFNVGQDEVPTAVDRLANEHRTARKELADLEGQWVESTAAALWATAESCGTWKIVALVADYPLERAKRVAQALRGRTGAVVLAGVGGERPQLIFTRADDVDLDAGALLREAATAAGGRGGGRADWAQGGVPTSEALNLALSSALAKTRAAQYGTI